MLPPHRNAYPRARTPTPRHPLVRTVARDVSLQPSVSTRTPTRKGRFVAEAVVVGCAQGITDAPGGRGQRGCFCSFILRHNNQCIIQEHFERSQLPQTSLASSSSQSTAGCSEPRNSNKWDAGCVIVNAKGSNRLERAIACDYAGSWEGSSGILLIILIMLRKGIRQSSFSTEKSQAAATSHQHPSFSKAKSNTNPPTHEQQLSKELVRRDQEAETHVPVYRVTRTKFEKNNLRYSDNSPLKLRDKSGLSPYRDRQEFQAYNFGHLNQLESFDRKKKGRSYFYKRNEDRKDETPTETTKISSTNHPEPGKQVVVQLQRTTEARQPVELTVQEMHYEMVKTYQKCKRAHH